MWDSWDDVPDRTPGEVIEVGAEDLLPGDRLFRLDLTVTCVEGADINSTGDPVVLARYEETPGTDVWPADRHFTVIRNAPDLDCRSKVRSVR